MSNYTSRNQTITDPATGDTYRTYGYTRSYSIRKGYKTNDKVLVIKKKIKSSGKIGRISLMSENKVCVSFGHDFNYNSCWMNFDSITHFRNNVFEF